MLDKYVTKFKVLSEEGEVSVKVTRYLPEVPMRITGTGRGDADPPEPEEFEYEIFGEQTPPKEEKVLAKFKGLNGL